MKKSKEERKKLILELMGSDLYVPMKEKELAILLQVESNDRPLLKEVLEELLAGKKIEISKRGKYQLYSPKKEQEEIITGTFISNAKGFGFIEVEEREDDLYVPESYTNTAFHLDVVEAVILPGRRGRRTEAKIVRIVERGTEQVVGTYQKSNKSFGFVVPDNRKLSSDIYIRNEHSKGAVEGHKVVVELTSYGSDNKSPEGRIVEILGHINDPGVDILSIAKGYGLATEFPEKVMNQAEKTKDYVIEADLAGRDDLRGLFMVTIDGEDAKDLDDAVSLEMEGKNFVLGVHIADVANYVQENSALDHEALNRATSVYLVDRVIPMLPHKLSNGICSLNAGEDRLALSCIMKISPDGKVVDYKIAESVINVNHRMNYTSVNKIIALGDLEERNKFADTVDMLDKMYELSRLIREQRRKRGSIDFDIPESKIILNEMGDVLEIKPYERNAANMLIEDFMLMANETVAQHFYWLEKPFVYRTHGTPDPEKIEKLAAFINNYGYHIHMAKEEIHPKEIQKLLAEIEGSGKEDMIASLALRSMKQARYSTECLGHFGLACKYYCHFTSPIRRYPDLQIHRIIKDELRGRMKPNKLAHYEEILPEVAERSSRLERRAAESEREVNKLKKAQYMENHIGEEFEGIVSGITEWGLYVQLENTVEGMVHISKLPGDYYIYDESSYEIKGTRHGKKYELGQKVRISVAGADTTLRTVDFDMV